MKYEIPGEFGYSEVNPTDRPLCQFSPGWCMAHRTCMLAWDMVGWPLWTVYMVGALIAPDRQPGTRDLLFSYQP